MNILLNDPETKLPSTTRTVFFYGCMVCICKLAFSNVSIYNFHFNAFNGSDFGMAIAALGGIYALDKHIGNVKKEQ